MMAPQVTAFSRRETYAWPGHDRHCEGVVHTLEHVLTHAFRTDVHYSQYRHPTGRRLSVDALTRLEADGAPLPVADVVCFDVDSHTSTARQLRDWRKTTAEKINTLPGAPFAHWTRAGARVLYRLREPFEFTPSSAIGWKRRYLRAALLAWKHCGLVCDAACCDWTRLFRAPNVIREGERQTHGIVRGDPANVGTFPRHGWRAATDSAGLPYTFERLSRHTGWSSPGVASLIFAHPSTPAPTAPAPKVATPKADNGAARALAHALEAIRNAGHGDRNRTLYAQAAWLLGEQAKRGRFAQVNLVETLREAAVTAGLAHLEAKDTIASAWRAAHNSQGRHSVRRSF